MAATLDDQRIEQTPDYWLIVLLRALRQSNLAMAGEAQERLSEMGIDIRFGRLLADEGDDANNAPPIVHVVELQPRWLSLEAAARYCWLSTKSLRRLIASGKIIAYRPVRGKILLDRVEIDSLIGSATAQPRIGRGLRSREREAAV